MSMTSGKQNRVAAGLRRRGALLAAALRPPGAGRPAGPSPGGEDDGAVAPSKVPRLVESPVFVLCSVRSGSTLLRVLLNSHSRIRAPHELHLRHLRVRPGRDFTHDIMGELGLDVRELEMWTKAFGGGNDQGAGSAIAVLLFVLVVPAMLFNIRRMRQERT